MATPLSERINCRNVGGLAEQLVGWQPLYHFSHMLGVFFSGPGVNEYVVQIDEYAVQHVPQHIVYKLLEDGSTVA